MGLPLFVWLSYGNSDAFSAGICGKSCGFRGQSFDYASMQGFIVLKNLRAVC